MIEIAGITTTYCHRCRKAAKCGEIEVLEWVHKIDICSSCLMEFARKIDMNNDRRKNEFNQTTEISNS